MSRPQFLARSIEGDRLTLDEAESGHAMGSFRLTPGDEVRVTDGCGDVVEGRIAAGSTAAAVTIEVDRREHVSEPPNVRVCPAVPKKGKLDLVVEKLTEIGVRRISPWFASRSVVRWDEAKCASQAERLRSIARAALKQSKRAWLPKVDEPGSLDDLSAAVFVLEYRASQSLRVELAATGSPRTGITLVIGPEGGLDHDERERFRALGAREVSLGDGVLRSETAAIVASVLVMADMSLLG